MNYKQKTLICKCCGIGEKSGINLKSGSFKKENEAEKTGEENGIISSADRLPVSFMKKLKKIFGQNWRKKRHQIALEQAVSWQKMGKNGKWRKKRYRFQENRRVKQADFPGKIFGEVFEQADMAKKMASIFWI